MGQARREAETKELIKLISARSDFAKAKASCDHLLTLESDPGSSLYNALATATVVCYVRPFTDNQPHGSVKTKPYDTLFDDEGARFHQKAIDARHSVFAHSELNTRRAYLLSENGTFRGTGFEAHHYVPRFFEGLQNNLELMIEHATSRITTLVGELYDGQQLPDRLEIVLQ